MDYQISSEQNGLYSEAKQLQPASSDEWYFFAGSERDILKKLKQQPKTLGDITRKIFVGLQTSADKIYVLEVIEEKENSIIAHSRSLDKNVELEKGFVKPFLMGKDVHRYKNLMSKYVVIFPYLLIENTAQLMSEKHIEQTYPLGWCYITENREALIAREKGRFKETWWQYGRLNNLTEFEVAKIITPDICNYSQMSLDESGTIYHTTTLYSFVFNQTVKENLKYFLGLMNSKLMWFYMKSTGTILRGGYIRYKTAYMQPFPIRTIDFDNADDTAQHDKMVTLVQTMLDLHKQLAAASGAVKQQIQKNIAATDRDIDQLVYALYDLTPEEIAIVEG